MLAMLAMLGVDDDQETSTTGFSNIYEAILFVGMSLISNGEREGSSKDRSRIV